MIQERKVINEVEEAETHCHIRCCSNYPRGYVSDELNRKEDLRGSTGNQPSNPSAFRSVNMRKVNQKVRSALLQTMKPYPKQHHLNDREEEKNKQVKLEESRRIEAEKLPYTSISTKERRIALQQDVDELKRNLTYEESLHRVLERAFSRTPGAPPHLPPHLPSDTLELLEEVAMLEEEVLRLEKHVLSCRHDLYQEAVLMSSSKKSIEKTPENLEDSRISSHFETLESLMSDDKHVSLARLLSDPDDKTSIDSLVDDDTNQKEKPNYDISQEETTTANSCSSKKRSNQKPPRSRSSGSSEKYCDPEMELSETKSEKEDVYTETTPADDIEMVEDCGSPNKISENILRCLIGILSNSMEKTGTSSDGKATGDPYGISQESKRRDVGRYRRFIHIHQNSINPSSCTASLSHKLKVLLRKLAFSDLRDLTHQQKLAFWINVYNSCMMNAFLEQGVPSCSHKVVELMQKATINVGGYLLTAMIIEHMILRFPYHSNNVPQKIAKDDTMTLQSTIGLDRFEPLVTFALACGSWSSPAVRVYSPCQVERELEVAKKDYLQAAVGISVADKLLVPKLLDWYLVDFAKDIESLVNWVCSNLPNRSRCEIIRCIERAKREMDLSSWVQVIPYDFTFRYILAK